MDKHTISDVIPTRTTLWARAFSLACLLALVCACQNWAWSRSSLQSARASVVDPSPVKWTKCDDTILCGSLEVPLNYQSPSPGTAVLALAKYPAKPTTGSRLGTVFLNLGGSGGSVMANFFAFAADLSEMLEGRYDLVVWDVRGVNGTTPRIECFPSQTSQDIFFLRTARQVPLSVGNLSLPSDMSVFLHAVKVESARNAALVELCVNRTGVEVLRNVGSTTVARDLELIARTLEPGKPVNFWGFSYGTFLGQVFANMFPDRVGRMVLDGIVDPLLWTGEHRIKRYTPFMQDMQATFHGFVDNCAAAGSARCKLASNGSTADDIELKVTRLLDELYDKPLPVPHAKRPGVLTKGDAVGFLYWSLFVPLIWPLAAEYIQAAIDGDGAPILNDVQPDVHLDGTTRAETVMGLVAVPCMDAPPYTAQERADGIQEIVDNVVAAMEVTPIFGAMPLPDMCHLWPVAAGERYTGPFNSLDREILLIGNTYDPLSPLVNARKVHSMLKRSFLIQQDGYGHTSLVQESSCRNDIVRDYFVNGKSPEEREVICPVDDPVFPEQGSSLVTEARRRRLTSLWRRPYMG